MRNRKVGLMSSAEPRSALLDPVKVGDLTLNNRVVLAPMTRSKASPGRLANSLIAEYYAQRASAGLIVTEATSVSPQERFCLPIRVNKGPLLKST